MLNCVNHAVYIHTFTQVLNDREMADGMRIDWSQITLFRRKKNRLEWHFKEDCRKWPLEEFEQNQEGKPVLSTMVCPICIGIHSKENGLVDTRVPKVVKAGFFS